MSYVSWYRLTCHHYHILILILSFHQLLVQQQLYPPVVGCYPLYPGHLHSHPGLPRRCSLVPGLVVSRRGRLTGRCSVVTFQCCVLHRPDTTPPIYLLHHRENNSSSVTVTSSVTFNHWMTTQMWSIWSQFIRTSSAVLIFRFTVTTKTDYSDLFYTEIQRRYLWIKRTTAAYIRRHLTTEWPLRCHQVDLSL